MGCGASVGMAEGATGMITRAWAMPSKNTFSIKPIAELLRRYIINPSLWIDPFARDSSHAFYSNDLNPDTAALFHMESLEFLSVCKTIPVAFEGVLFDPPYSPRQISECYQQIGRKVHISDTQSSFYGNRKNAIADILNPNGLVICCGWNSNGIGLKRGFEMIEILMVAHGGAHNDTIVTVERKI